MKKEKSTLEQLLEAPPLKGETQEQARARRLRWLEKAKYYIAAANAKTSPPPAH